MKTTAPAKEPTPFGKIILAAYVRIGLRKFGVLFLQTEFYDKVVPYLKEEGFTDAELARIQRTEKVNHGRSPAWKR